MSPEATILAAICLPLAGALAIGLAGRVHPNLRETVTMVTAVALAWLVWSLLPILMAGGRPAVTISEVMPGLSIAFSVEPLGMLFAALASGLWIVNSIYSIGYMRGNKEKNQTRFFVCFALALSELLTLSTYPLVSHKGDAATVRSARVYLGVLLTTSIGLFLPAIIWTYTVAGTGDFVLGGILAGNLGDPEVGLLLALFVFGIGKAAVMPVHRWLPAAMVAPTPVSALLLSLIHI